MTAPFVYANQTVIGDGIHAGPTSNKKQRSHFVSQRILIVRVGENDVVISGTVNIGYCKRVTGCFTLKTVEIINGKGQARNRTIQSVRGVHDPLVRTQVLAVVNIQPKHQIVLKRIVTEMRGYDLEAGEGEFRRRVQWPPIETEMRAEPVGNDNRVFH